MAAKDSKKKNSGPGSIYAAFDTFPAPKGAAVHIREFAHTLFKTCPDGLLLVLGNEELPSWQIEDGFEVRRLFSETDNYLAKAMEFSAFVGRHISLVAESLKIAHFRDPWGGIPILDLAERRFKTVYEVNALPSIELPARYSGLGERTLSKIRQLEKRCWEEADKIICPSGIIKKCLTDLGADPKKISIIANGSNFNIEDTNELFDDAPENYLIYFGAVQSWQGIEVLFKAMTFLRDLKDLHLVMCVSGNKARLKYLQKLAQRMEISDRLVWQLKISQPELQPWLKHATISVAPLTECARNLVQGCCPIKIVESMSLGIPVIASDMPVVRELLVHNQTGWLVRPDRPSELARAIRILLSNSEQRTRIGNEAKKLAHHKYTWKKITAALSRHYKKLLHPRK